jgi:hypothetical protein
MLIGTGCSVCEVGKFKDLFGIETCTLCNAVISGSTTRGNSATTETECVCPENTYLSLDGKECVKIAMDGVDGATSGMRLENLKIKPGSWRTNEKSTDVRPCPVEEACVGGNNVTEYCREGHVGPYCNLCKEGFSKDVFGLCQKCDMSTESLAISIATGIGLLIAGFVGYVVWGRWAKKNRRKSNKIVGGVKILFVTYQILAGLPTIIPAIALPENFKAMLSWLQFFNLNLFQMVSVGCYTGSFNFFSMLLGTTLGPGFCIIFLLIIAALKGKRGDDEGKKGFVHGAFAASYLVLPTVTTTIFAAFPCDPFDDGRTHLRADYSISCEGGAYKAMVVYAGAMLLLYPVGTLSIYTWTLIRNKSKIKEEVEVREEDEELMSKAFLFENYKPECWWFEIVETIRRLLLTSALGLIEPGTDTQLAAGLIMAVFGFGIFCGFKPYLEKRDNLLSILSSVQIFLVVLSAFVMKRRKGVGVGGEGGGDEYDAKYLGVVLIALNVGLVVVFMGSGVVSKVVKNKFRREGREHGSTTIYDVFSGLRDSLGWRRRNSGGPALEDERADEGGEIELGDVYAVERPGGMENPMRRSGLMNDIPVSVVNPKVGSISEQDIPPPLPPCVKGVV